MDGMTEACVKGGIEACYSSVSCACALLRALDELSQGRGLQPEQVRPRGERRPGTPLGPNVCNERFERETESAAVCQARLLLRRLDELKDGTESTRESMEINEADFRWQRHILSSEQDAGLSAPDVSAAGAAERSPDISISITTETGQTTLDLETEGLGLGPSHTPPEERGEDARLPSPLFYSGREAAEREQSAETNQVRWREEGGGAGEVDGRGEKRGGGGVVPPDVVQRSHALVYPDITNFLSVESRTRSHHAGGSRYSESNFRYECERVTVMTS